MDLLTSPHSKPAASPLESLKQPLKYLSSEDIQLQLQGATQIVRLLQKSDETKSEHILDYLISRDAIQTFAKFLASDHEQLKVQAGCLFGFLSCGSTRHATAVFTSNAIPTCIGLLSASNMDLRVQTAWILGNLAGESAEYAIKLLGDDVPSMLLKHVDATLQNPSLAAELPHFVTFLWAINHFLKAIPHSLSPEFKRQVGTLYTDALLKDAPKTICEECCHGLTTLLRDNEDLLKNLMRPKLNEHIVDLLSEIGTTSLRSAALQLIGTITASNLNECIDSLLDADLVASVGKLIPISPLTEDACWALSNLSAGASHHLEAILDDDEVDVVSTLLDLITDSARSFDEDENERGTREACTIIANIVNKSSQSDPGVVRVVVSKGTIRSLCTVLKYTSDPDTLILVLDTLWKMIVVGESDRIAIAAASDDNGEGLNIYLKLFEAGGGHQGLERIVKSKERLVSDAAKQMQDLLYDLLNPGEREEGSPEEPEISTPQLITKGSSLSATLDKSLGLDASPAVEIAA